VAERLKGKSQENVLDHHRSPHKRIADEDGLHSHYRGSRSRICHGHVLRGSPPIQGRFKVMATDSAKACYYAAG